MGSLKVETKMISAVAALALQFAASGAMAADLLAHAKQLALPARAYPELTQVNDQVAVIITRMETNTNQLKEYRKARIRATDRRYSALTREFNQSRSRLSEIERKLDKAPSLDVNRFPAPPGSDRGSSSSDIRERAMAAEYKKYDQAKASLKQSLKTLSDHYDLQLREIAKLR
jgi:hypothetical protein